MNATHLQKIRRYFHTYVREYLGRSGSMTHMMQLKRVHCAFVARNCRELAFAEHWDEQETNVAEAIGFLHDLGRFPQLEEYGTFSDAHSIDHGERGFRALIEGGLLREIPSACREIILTAVRYHNRRVLPDNLLEEHYAYLKIIRDADRLDIYRVVCDAVTTGKIEEHPEIGLGLPVKGNPSPDLLKRIQERESPSYSDLRCVSDFLLLILSWGYQMNYPSTLKIMRDRKIVDQLSGHLPIELPEVKQVIDGITREIESV